MKSLRSILHSLLFALCLANPAGASTVYEAKFTCPIDRAKFKQYVDGSGTSFGSRLDFMPLGPTAAPWAVPQCPKCRFVLYDEKFDKPAIKKLRPFILSESYRAATRGQSSYYCLALIREYMGADPVDVGFLYLQASWQVESEPAKCKQYLQQSYERQAAGLKSLKRDDIRYVRTALLCGELERRLGKFETAKRRFTALKLQAVFRKAPEKTIIDRQLSLIAKLDSKPHGVTKEDEKVMAGQWFSARETRAGLLGGVS